MSMLHGLGFYFDKRLVLAFLLSIGLCAWSLEAQPMADDPLVEARLLVIAQELRCLVCQNESLAASRAELAEDLKREVRILIKKGNTDQEIKDFLVSRYGDFVLYRPQVKPLTWGLWFGPALALLCGLWFLMGHLKQRLKNAPASKHLSHEEQERLNKILKD
ncbi:MAG: cytochrome c-type biogenesis protein CcmH [Burkholderiaceae bacterium]